MDERGDSTASHTRRRRLARKGDIIIITKRYNPAIRRSRSRTDRARGIFEALKALKRKAPDSAMEDKIDFKTAEQARDLAVKQKGSGKKKLPTCMIKRIKFGKRLIRKRKNEEKWDFYPDIRGRGDSETVEETNDLGVQPKEQPKVKVHSFEKMRIRYGKSLMRKRKNGWNWKYNPGLEPSINVKLFGEDVSDEDEDMDVDKVKDEECEEYEEDKMDYSAVPSRPRYQSFDKSGRRAYFVFLADEGPFDRNYYEKLFKKGLKCSECNVNDRLLRVTGSDDEEVLTLDLTEAEADDFAGLEEICCVQPMFASWEYLH